MNQQTPIRKMPADSAQNSKIVDATITAIASDLGMPIVDPFLNPAKKKNGKKPALNRIIFRNLWISLSIFTKKSEGADEPR